MSLNLDKYFGIHEQALKLQSERSKLLANNLANADTPHFKAKDIDFKDILQNAQSGQATSLNRTHPGHVGPGGRIDPYHVMYRTPTQPDTGDGNTVDTQVEQAKFSENTLRYNASLTFLTGSIKGMMTAIRGE